MRLINEDDALEIIERVTNEAVEKNQRKYLIQPRIIAEISGLPTIEAELVKHGRWEMNSDYPDRLICNQCNSTYDMYFCERDSMHYCPNCGSKQDLGGDSDDEP